jgi:hypothetical protein
VRPASEPLEGFAARLASADDDELAREAAPLLLRYARHRYGGEGEPAKLDDEMENLVTRCG